MDTLEGAIEKRQRAMDTLDTIKRILKYLKEYDAYGYLDVREIDDFYCIEIVSIGNFSVEGYGDTLEKAVSEASQQLEFICDYS